MTVALGEAFLCPNRLLTTVSDNDLQPLLAKLDMVEIKLKENLYKRGEPIPYIYFSCRLGRVACCEKLKNEELKEGIALRPARIAAVLCDHDESFAHDPKHRPDSAMQASVLMNALAAARDHNRSSRHADHAVSALATGPSAYAVLYFRNSAPPLFRFLTGAHCTVSAWRRSPSK